VEGAVRKLLHVFLILAICTLIQCSKSTEEKSEQPEGEPGVETESAAPAGKVMTSTDGLCQVTTQGGWEVTKGLHKKAKLQISNPYKEMFLVVFSEKKDMFPDLKLEDHSKETVKNLLETMNGGYAKPAVEVTLDGNRALINEVRGKAGNNMKIVYVHANVETPFYFHEVLAWTPDKRYNQNKYELDSVVKSFKEVKAAPAAETSKS
jgi:hypothetical protein